MSALLRIDITIFDETPKQSVRGDCTIHAVSSFYVINNVLIVSNTCLKKCYGTVWRFMLHRAVPQAYCHFLGRIKLFIRVLNRTRVQNADGHDA